jgi:quercetin dioxygenase-like cupin family protein
MSTRLTFAALAAVAAAASAAPIARATPAAGFTGVTAAFARFEEFDIKNKSIPADTWMEQLKTKGDTDVYVQQNTWAPGGSTGWHTHPGASFIMVTSGTVTAYEGDDPACAPHVYTAGQGFVDPGGEHVHIIRNQGTTQATSVTVQLIQAGQPRRIDAPDPGNCIF